MLLDPSVARAAVELALPMIEPAVASRRAGAGGFLYIVVMDPRKPFGTVEFPAAILYEHAVGDPARWDADYAGFARAKARLSWRTGRSGQEVQQALPHLLDPGDTLLEGGVCADGLVVAVSGAESWFDEAFAHTVLQLCRALARERRQELADSGLLTAPARTVTAG